MNKSTLLAKLREGALTLEQIYQEFPFASTVIIDRVIDGLIKDRDSGVTYELGYLSVRSKLFNKNEKRQAYARKSYLPNWSQN